MAHSGSGLFENWTQQAERLLTDAHVLYFVSKHPRTRWYIKCVAACSVAYLFSPVQLIPSFIPVIGFLDDFLVLLAAAKFVRRFTPPDLLQECRKLAEASEMSGEEHLGFESKRSAAFQSAVWWLVVAGAVSAFVFAYMFHFW
jgi:uncharacterized membrane protein YkvA (DUF1232 family)